MQQSRVLFVSSKGYCNSPVLKNKQTRADVNVCVSGKLKEEGEMTSGAKS